MKLYHTTKNAKVPNTIVIDAEAAVSPKAFLTKTVKSKGIISHLGLVWRLPVLVDPTTKSRHDGHVFEILVEPEWLDQLEAAIQVARERFAVAAIPAGRRVEEPPIPEPSEDDEDEDED